MRSNYTFKNADEALRGLASDLASAPEVGSRAGRTKELTMVGVTLQKPTERYLVTPPRKASLAAQIAETMWVLAGRDDVEFISHYLPRAIDFSDDGRTWRGAYGARLRSWPHSDGSDDVADQISWVVEHLKKDPASRRATLSIFDPIKDQAPGKDIPCNDWIDFKSRLGYLDMHVALRSNDLIWGWSGINQFEWSALLEIVAHLTGQMVGELHFSISSLHIYDRHWARAEKISQYEEFLPEELKPSPAFDMDGMDRTIDNLDALILKWFAVEQAIRRGNPSANKAVANFPEPMLRSWLRVLQWWWSGDQSFLDEYRGTRLWLAAAAGVQPKTAEAQKDERPDPGEKAGDVTFSTYVAELHAKKHAAYGDSWKKRGEQVGILANIARKVDRLGKTDDLETAADTAIDLLVYLIKYRWWLYDEGYMGAPLPHTTFETREEKRVEAYLKSLNRSNGGLINRPFEKPIQHGFETMLGHVVEEDRSHLADEVTTLIRQANALARREFWEANNEKRSWKGYGDE